MPGPKQNNNRKYPDANRQPRHKAAERIGRAQARQEHYDSLTLEQKIALLPPEPHAKKQRARLMSLLEKQNLKAAVKQGEKDIEEGKTSPHEEVKSNLQKKYMKGK
jgi:hypothetical protein